MQFDVGALFSLTAGARLQCCRQMSSTNGCAMTRLFNVSTKNTEKRWGRRDGGGGVSGTDVNNENGNSDTTRQILSF